jgi:hypothetical protein
LCPYQIESVKANSESGAQSSAAPHDWPELRPVRIKTAAARGRTGAERRVRDRKSDVESGLQCRRQTLRGQHSEVFVFKTPHHRDYKFDRLEPMVKVALATAAAPTHFRPLQHNGYTLVDGGVWATIQSCWRSSKR